MVSERSLEIMQSTEVVREIKQFFLIYIYIYIYVPLPMRCIMIATNMHMNCHLRAT